MPQKPRRERSGKNETICDRDGRSQWGTILSCLSAPTHLQGWEGGSCWWAYPFKVETDISPGREGYFPGSVESFAEPAFGALMLSIFRSSLSCAGAQHLSKKNLSLALSKQLCPAWASGQPGPACPGALRPVPGLWLRVFTPVFVRGGREGRGRCWGNWNNAGCRAGWVRWPGRARGLQGRPLDGVVHSSWPRVSWVPFILKLPWSGASFCF